jgi:hypothetical protein
MTQRYILLTLLLFLAACSGAPQTSDQYTGREGVTVQFQDGNPPRTVYDNQPFFVFAELRNRGAHSINDSDKPLVAILDTSNLFYLEHLNPDRAVQEVLLDGKTQFSNGEETMLNFGRFRIANRDAIGEVQDASKRFDAQICYPYSTEMSDTICIQNNLAQDTRSTVCTPQERYTYSGTGAPIGISEARPVLIPVGTEENTFQTQEGVFEDGQLTDVETQQRTEQQQLYQPSITLTIQNYGSGTPQTTKGNQDHCATNANRNTVDIQASLGGNPLGCNDETVELINGKATVECVLESDTVTIQSNYQSVLNVELQYTYKDTATTTVQLRQRPGLQ